MTSTGPVLLRMDLRQYGYVIAFIVTCLVLGPALFVKSRAMAMFPPMPNPECYSLLPKSDYDIHVWPPSQRDVSSPYFYNTGQNVTLTCQLKNMTQNGRDDDPYMVINSCNKNECGQWYTSQAERGRAELILHGGTVGTSFGNLGCQFSCWQYNSTCGLPPPPHLFQHFPDICVARDANFKTIMFKELPQPMDFMCVSPNWERLDCTLTLSTPSWLFNSNANNSCLLTWTYDCRSKTGEDCTDLHPRQVQLPIKSSASSSGTCTMQFPSDDFQMGRKYSLSFVILTRFGDVSANYSVYTDKSIVQFDPVKELTVSSDAANVTLLHVYWKFPTALELYKIWNPVLECQCHVVSLTDWHELDKMVPVTTAECKQGNFTVSGLHPALTYKVLVRYRLRSSMYWSEESEQIVTTGEDVPSDAPEMTVGGYVFSDTPDSGSHLTVYFQSLPKQYQNGRLTSYRLQVYPHKLNKLQPLPVKVDTPGMEQTVSASSRSITMKGIKLEAVVACVTAGNAVGFSSVSSCIEKPPKDQQLPSRPQEVIVTRMAEQNSYVIQWAPVTPGSVTGEYMTVFWCKGSYDNITVKCEDGVSARWQSIRATPHQLGPSQESDSPVDASKPTHDPHAQSDIQWENVNSSTTSFAVNVSEMAPSSSGSGSWYFGVASIMGKLSRGIAWSSCTFLENGKVKAPDVIVSNIQETELTLTWVVNCEEVYARPERYEVYYIDAMANGSHSMCRGHSSDVFDRNDGNKFDVKPKYPRNEFVLTHLRAGATYSLCLSTVSASGGRQFSAVKTVTLKQARKSDEVSPGLIAGIVVVSVVVVLGLVMGVFIFCRRRVKKKFWLFSSSTLPDSQIKVIVKSLESSTHVTGESINQAADIRVEEDQTDPTNARPPVEMIDSGIDLQDMNHSSTDPQQSPDSQDSAQGEQVPQTENNVMGIAAPGPALGFTQNVVMPVRAEGPPAYCTLKDVTKAAPGPSGHSTQDDVMTTTVPDPPGHSTQDDVMTATAPAPPGHSTQVDVMTTTVPNPSTYSTQVDVMTATVSNLSTYSTQDDFMTATVSNPSAYSTQSDVMTATVSNPSTYSTQSDAMTATVSNPSTYSTQSDVMTATVSNPSTHSTHNDVITATVPGPSGYCTVKDMPKSATGPSGYPSQNDVMTATGPSGYCTVKDMPKAATGPSGYPSQNGVMTATGPSGYCTVKDMKKTATGPSGYSTQNEVMTTSGPSGYPSQNNVMAASPSGYSSQNDVMTATVLGLSGYSSQNDIMTASPSAYSSQDVMNANPSGYSTQSDVMTATVPGPSGYCTVKDVTKTFTGPLGYSTQNDVMTATGPSGYCTQNDVMTATGPSGYSSQNDVMTTTVPGPSGYSSQNDVMTAAVPGPSGYSSQNDVMTTTVPGPSGYSSQNDVMTTTVPGPSGYSSQNDVMTTTVPGPSGYSSQDDVMTPTVPGPSGYSSQNDVMTATGPSGYCSQNDVMTATGPSGYCSQNDVMTATGPSGYCSQDDVMTPTVPGPSGYCPVKDMTETASGSADISVPTQTPASVQNTDKQPMSIQQKAHSTMRSGYWQPNENIIEQAGQAVVPENARTEVNSQVESSAPNFSSALHSGYMQHHGSVTEPHLPNGSPSCSAVVGAVLLQSCSSSDQKCPVPEGSSTACADSLTWENNPPTPTDNSTSLSLNAAQEAKVSNMDSQQQDGEIPDSDSTSIAIDSTSIAINGFALIPVLDTVEEGQQQMEMVEMEMPSLFVTNESSSSNTGYLSRSSPGFSMPVNEEAGCRSSLVSPYVSAEAVKAQQKGR